MDPLSSAASVIAIIGAANVVLRSIDRLRSLIKAPEAIDALIHEVQALRALLRDVGEAQELLKQASLSLSLPACMMLIIKRLLGTPQSFSI